MKKIIILAAIIITAALVFVFNKYDIKIDKAGAKKYEQVEQKEKDRLNSTFHSLVSNDELVFINVWATWCKPCIEELPELQQFATELQELVVKRFL